MSRRGRLTAAAASAALAVTTVGGCASLPTSGNVRLSTLNGSGGGSAQVGVQILPVPPGSRWDAVQIVHGFLAASASFADRHRAARDYLTPAYARRWRPGWAATVIGVPAITQPRPAGRFPTGSPPGVWVNVTGRYVAKMTTAAPYAAGNVVVSPGPYQYQFAMTDDNGHWRIDDIYLNGQPASPATLLLTQPDFQWDYQPRNLYFFPLDPAAKTLIPEPVYIPLQASGPQAVRGLVRSLFSPPPVSSWLYGAATTAFPGTVPISVRVVGGVKAVINLGGKAATASQARLSRMAAQLYATLTSSPYSPGTQIRSVVLEVNNRVWQGPLPPPYASWIPRAGAGLDGTQLYFQGPGKFPAPDIEVMTGSKPVPVSLPRGLGGEPFTAVAATPGPADRVVLAGCIGKRVYLIPQWPGARPTSPVLPAGCTSLSWDPHQNLWLTAGGYAWVLRGAGLGGPVGPVARAYCTACSGAVTMLRVAPDGVRVAMIVSSRSGPQVMVGAISTKGTSTYLGRLNKLVRVGSDIPDPGALTWLDPDHLLVLDQAGSASSQIYEVPLNGGSSTQVTTPRRAAWLAASWPDADILPHVVVGVTRPAPEVLAFNAGLLDRGWSLVAKGSSPVLPG